MSKGTPRTIYLTTDLEERLRYRTLATGRSASWVIRDLLERELPVQVSSGMALLVTPASPEDPKTVAEAEARGLLPPGDRLNITALEKKQAETDPDGEELRYDYEGE